MLSYNDYEYNARDLYSDNLKNASYNNTQYNVKVHALQTALSFLGYNIDKAKEYSNSNAIDNVKYGYYSPTTELIIKSFQNEHNIVPNGKMTKETWYKVFNSLENETNSELKISKDGNLEIFSKNKSAVPKQTEILSDSTNNTSNMSANKLLANEIEDDYDNFPPYEKNTVSTAYRDIKEKNNQLTDGNEQIISPNTASIQSYLALANKTPEYRAGVVKDKFYENLNASNNWKSLGGKVKNIKNTVGDKTNYVSFNNTGQGREYSIINSLLANSIYEGNLTNEPMYEYKTTPYSDIGKCKKSFETSQHSLPFFNKNNNKTFRKAHENITIVYGASGEKAIKIVDVMYRTKSQSIDASGEAVYDVIEFVAKDAIETDNKLKK